MKKEVSWKTKFHNFNQARLKPVEKIVKHMIPWLVLILLLIVVGEFAHDINGLLLKIGLHELHFLTVFGDFIHHHEIWVITIDYIIISFFAFELYFNFFESETWKLFIRNNFLEMLALIPVGLIMGTIKLTTSAQQATHATIGSHKIVGKTVKSGKALKIITRIPRFIRLLKLRKLFKI
ncbi:hypothetical protein GOV06_01150 [Candidatus Woesearchaeota archaeon]|nr:hypothetical protein [Candidatus Woesearchaeota archaeon]